MKKINFKYETVHMTVYAGKKSFADNGATWCKVVLWVSQRCNNVVSQAMSVPFPIWLRNPASIERLLHFARMYGESIINEEGSNEAYALYDYVFNDDTLEGVDVVKEYRHAYSDFGYTPCHETVQFDSIRIKVDKNGKALKTRNGQSILSSKALLTYWDGCWREDLCREARMEELMRQWIVPTVADDEDDDDEN